MSLGVSKGADSSQSSQSGSGGWGTSGNMNMNLGQGWNNSLAMGSGGGTNSQNVWGGQSPYLEGMYGHASQLNNAMRPYEQQEGANAAGYIGGVQQGAMPAWQEQLGGGVYGEGGAGQDYINQLQGVASGQGTNAYQDQLKQSMIADAGAARGDMMNSMDARAAASGMSGGSSHGTATAKGNEDINRNLQSNMANVGYQAAESEKARQMQANQMLGNVYGQQQNTMTNALGQSGNMANLGMAGFNPLQAQWGSLQNMAGIMGGPTVLGQGQNWNNNFNLGMGGNQSLGLGGGTAYNENWNRSESEGDTDGGFGVNVGTGMKL